VVSRRAVVEASMGEERAKLLENLKEGAIVKGTVKNITDYGAFVDLGGIDGLLHITDLAWRRVRHPSEVVQVGQELTAKVLKFDQEKNRVSLGVKQLGEDPWVGLGRRYPQGTRLFGKVTNITDYGAFVEIEAGIEGLVHLSDLSWSEPGEEAVRKYKKGDEIEAMVLAIDTERERISLGVKQMSGDPFTNFAAGHEKGSIVTGTVKSVDAKGAVIDLGGDIEGYLRASEIAADRVEDARNHLKEGDSVIAMIINVDRKNRGLNLSIKAKDTAETSATMERMQAEAQTGTTNLGALLKAKLDTQTK
jgi:small subunit ribosomal protein S1